MSDRPKLQPPSRPPSFPDGKAAGNKTLISAGIFILVVFALIVVFVFPGKFGNRHIQDNKSDVQLTVQRMDTGQTLYRENNLVSETENEIKLSEAKNLLKKSLKLLADLESQGVKAWGSYKMVTSYGEAVDSLAKANSHLDSQRFDEAIKWYNQSIEQLEQLSAGRDKRLHQSLIEGQKAVSQFDSTSALRHFNIALAIDPGNEEARRGINRANVTDQVIALVEQAKKEEASGNLDSAREFYRNAFSLDSGRKTVEESLGRVDGLILEREFKAAMSAAMAALDKNDFSEARLKLKRAGKLRPNDPGIKDLEQQIDTISLAAGIQSLKKLAAGYEADEKWQEALDTYNKVLKEDSNAGFAQKGRVKSMEMIRLYSQIGNYISNPDDLQPLKNMEHARNLYTVAVSRVDAGPVLQSMAVRLNNLIESYSKTSPVLFQSDNMTDVMIYRVGRLDRFSEKMLDLKPGQYKALGTRSGYRDVIVLFTVPPDGKAPTTVLIACEEKI